MTKEQFLEKLPEKHKRKYDYSKIPEEFSVKDKLIFICPIHGEFEQRVDSHLGGKGCKQCGHIKTGLSVKKYNLDKISNETSILKDINIINEPKIPNKNYIVGSIYIFINNINNKVYIGQTYKKYTDRWSQHKNSNDTCYFHLALKKYGWDNFSKYILFQTEFYLYNEENIKIVNNILNKKEIYYIDYFKSNDSIYGYNLTDGGKDIVKINKEFPNRKTYSKKVEQYDLQGNLINTWNSIKEVDSTTKFKRQGIIDCSNGKIDSYKNFIWKIIIPKKKIKDLNISKNSKPLLQYDLDGNYIAEYKNSNDVHYKLGYNPSNIRACCNKVQNVSQGYIWIFKNNSEILKKLPLEELEERDLDKRVVQYDLNMNLINIWKDCAEAGRSLGLNRQSIAACVKGNSKTSFGYIWKKTTLRELINNNIFKYE